jgi:hypothetical protein
LLCARARSNIASISEWQKASCPRELHLQFLSCHQWEIFFLLPFVKVISTYIIGTLAFDMSTLASKLMHPGPKLLGTQVPESVIDGLFGRGLGYVDWRAELESQGFAWSIPLKFNIIEKEYDFFREEIQLMQSEPDVGRSRGSKAKSNSLESILKRLKGEVWIKGVPDEKEKRKREGRLLGEDAK